MKALVLLSGGVDSTTVAAIAVKEYGAKNVGAVSFLYGQKHSRELRAAREVALALGIKEHFFIQLPNVFAGYGSTLIDADRETPQTTYEELQKAEGVSPTYVPFRNGTLLAVSSAVALTHGASEVWYGAHAEDSRNWSYPDCTPEFNGSMGSAMYIGSGGGVRLVTPLQWLMKRDVVALAYENDAPLHLTYSCYIGREEQCGKCPTCVSRLEAFKSLGKVDPADYEA